MKCLGNSIKLEEEEEEEGFHIYLQRRTLLGLTAAEERRNRVH